MKIMKYKLPDHLFPLEVQVSIQVLKKYKSPCTDKIVAELIRDGGNSLLAKIYKLVLAIWKKDILQEQWKESIIVPIHKKGGKTNIVIIEEYHFY